MYREIEKKDRELMDDKEKESGSYLVQLAGWIFDICRGDSEVPP